MASSIKLKLETLTPVHIGTGVELNSNFEYLFFSEERIIAIIDEGKVLDIIGRENVNHWVSIIEKEEDLLNYIQARKKELQPIEIAKRLAIVEGEGPGKGNKIKAQLLGGVRKIPMIPGSSLKGSIRTAMLNELIKQNPEFVKQRKHLGYDDRRGRFVFSDQQVIAHYFGKSNRTDRRGNIQLDPNKDWMRLIRVFDGYFEDIKTTIHRVVILNKFNRGWGVKQRETSWWECIPKGAETTMQLQIPKLLLKEIEKVKYPSGPEGILAIAEIFNVLNNRTLWMINDELDFLDEEGNPEEMGTYYDTLEDFAAQIKSKKEGEAFIRVGAGSGWRFMTGGWPENPKYMNDDNWYDLKEQLRRRRYPEDLIYPKSRKLIAGGEPLGFVKLKLV